MVACRCRGCVCFVIFGAIVWLSQYGCMRRGYYDIDNNVVFFLHFDPFDSLSANVFISVVPMFQAPPGSETGIIFHPNYNVIATAHETHASAPHFGRFILAIIKLCSHSTHCFTRSARCIELSIVLVCWPRHIRRSAVSTPQPACAGQIARNPTVQMAFIYT